MDPVMQRPKISEISGYFEIQAKANVGFFFCLFVFFQILAKAMLLVISAFKEISILRHLLVFFCCCFFLFFFFFKFTLQEIATTSGISHYVCLWAQETLSTINAGTWEVVLIRTTQGSEHCPSYSSAKKRKPFYERTLETVYKESNSFFNKSQKRQLQSLLLTMPLLINEQLTMCEGSDCPDFGVDRALVTVTFLPHM